jgi:uncharacterized protein DUF6851
MTGQHEQPATHGHPRASLSDVGRSRRQFLAAAGAGGALLLLPRLPQTGSAARRVGSTRPGDSVVVSWNEAFLEGVRGSKLGPPMVARALAIGHTSIHDAWAAYDRKAVGTRLGGSLRRPPAERTLPNIRQAISWAAYRAACDLFPGSISAVFDPLMQTLGYDPGDLSTDTSTPTGIGNVAARAVLDFRHRDGANQLGDEPGGLPGVPYSDYTGYTPANTPMDIRFPFDPTTVHDPSAWQPLRYLDDSGDPVTQQFVGAQWQQVARSPSAPGYAAGHAGRWRPPHNAMAPALPIDPRLIVFPRASMRPALVPAPARYGRGFDNDAAEANSEGPRPGRCQ